MAESMDTDEFNILHFSDQVLPKIFVHLNDTDLFTVTKVCKRFKTIARDAFALKYNGQSLGRYYVVTVNSDDATQEPRPYWPFFNTFGDKMTALSLNLHIDFMHCSKMVRNHWLFCVIERKCTALKKLNVTLNGEEAPISLTGMIPIFSKLSHLTLHKMKMKNSKWTLNEYSKLICFQAIRVKGFQQPDVHEFIAKNPQLQQISLVRCEKISLTVLEKMHDIAKELRLLELITLDATFSTELEAIKMEKLESLKMSVGHSTIIGVLQPLAKGCENLRYLEVQPIKMDYKCEIRGDVIDVICSFKELRRLNIFGRNLQMKLLLILLRRLPKLFSLRILDDGKFTLTPHNILELFAQGKNLINFIVQAANYWPPNKDISFNSDFFHRFIEVAKDRTYAKVIWDQHEKTIITKEKITKDGQLVHWIGYEANRSLSSTHILQLSDKCIQKIFNYLDRESHRALYETCKRTRTEVRDHISKQLFKIDMDNLTQAQDIVRRFGDDITRLVINTPWMKKNRNIEQFWNNLMEKCGKKLVEIHIRKSGVDAMKGHAEIDFVSENNQFPNLTMLVLEDIHSADFSIFTVFNCPRLTHLELYECYIESPFIPNDDLSGVSIFKNLTSIKLDRVDDCMENVINSMDEASCGRVKEFTVGGYEDRNKSDDLMHMMLINVISRFRNLTTLNLIVAYMENTNIAYLFEHCTKLIKLSVAFESDFDFNNAKRMFRCVKDNCKQIETIQLIQRAFTTDSDGNEFDNTDQFDENFLKMVYDFFPRATISIVQINYHGDCIKEKRVTNTWARMVKRSL